MTLRDPAYIESAAYHAEMDRLQTRGVVAQGGVAGPYDLTPTPSASGGMRITVGPGSVFVNGGDDDYQGMYHCVNDDIYEVALAGANATQPRIDLIVARVNDPDYGATGNLWDLVAITGTPSAVPVVPTASMKAGDELIAQVRVDAATTALTTSKILSRRRIVRLRVAQTVGTQADRDLLEPYNGMAIFRDDLQQRQWYQGGQWYAPVVAAADGSVHIQGDVFVFGGTARLTTDYLTVNGNGNVGGSLSMNSLNSVTATIQNALQVGGNIVSSGTFIDRLGRDLLTLIGSGGLATDALAVGTNPSARPTGIYMTPAYAPTSFNTSGVFVTIVLGANAALQVFCSTTGSADGLNQYVKFALRTHNAANNGTWGPWRYSWSVNGETNGAVYYDGAEVTVVNPSTGATTALDAGNWATVSGQYHVDSNGWLSGHCWMQMIRDSPTQVWVNLPLPVAPSINLYDSFAVVGDFEFYKPAPNGGRVVGHLEVTSAGSRAAYSIGAYQDLTTMSGATMGGNGSGRRMQTDLPNNTYMTWRYGYYIA